MMLGKGYWGDVIITEDYGEPKGEMMIDIAKCHNCDNRAIIQGLCAECASKEIKRLRNENVKIFTMVKCNNCERGVRQRYNIHGLCHLCARKEMTRLRRIEKAIRECPRTLAQPGNIPALVETTQLRDALYGIENGGQAKMDWQRAYQKVSEILAERTEERDQLRREIKRLRAIEKAAMLCNHGNRQSSIEHWRMLGRVLDRKGLGWGYNCRAIADAL